MNPARPRTSPFGRQTPSTAQRKPVLDLRALFRDGRLSTLDLHSLPSMAAASQALGVPESTYSSQQAEDGQALDGAWWVQNWGTLELMHGPAGELLLWDDTFARQRPWLPGWQLQHGSLLRPGLPLAGIWRRLARARVGTVWLAVRVGHPYVMRVSGVSGASLYFESPDLSASGHRCVALGWESPGWVRPGLYETLAQHQFD